MADEKQKRNKQLWADRKKGMSSNELARKYKISPTNVFRIIRRMERIEGHKQED
jgi:Mor family transcriptional regulator|tara:strand:+ start:3382 stop:3543 length:162 start_codon:yes stop_codon:yes gene_type:complete